MKAILTMVTAYAPVAGLVMVFVMMVAMNLQITMMVVIVVLILSPTIGVQIVSATMIATFMPVVLSFSTRRKM